MKYRLARLEDLPVLNTISVRSKAYWGYPDSWIERWMDDLTISTEKFDNQSILLAELNDQVIGFCAVKEVPEQYEILHLWLLPQYIGKGYGKQLLHETLHTLASNNKPIIVEADPNAEAFYSSQGFVTFDKIESYPKGRFLPVMRKD